MASVPANGVSLKVAHAPCNGVYADGQAEPTLDDHLKRTVVAASATMDAAPYNTPPEKLQRAMDLVLSGSVQAHEDGLYTVKGSTKTYDIGHDCPCPQGQRQKSKWCKHLVAVELWKRTQERLYPQDAGETWVDTAKQNPSVNGSQAELPTPVCTVAEDTWPSPHWSQQDAPCIHTVKWTDRSSGIEHCVVLRGDDWPSVMSQVQAVTTVAKAHREVPASDPQTPAVPDPAFCTIHSEPMKQSQDGKGYFHKAGEKDDGKAIWCRGKA